MAGYMNRATLIGNLGQDPEIRSMQSGERVASFTLATTESWKDKRSGERQERTEWHRVVVWNEGLIGVLEDYVHKGDKVMVEGMLKTRKWVDQAGNERYTTEIVLSGFNGQLIMLGSPNGAARGEGAPASRNRTGTQTRTRTPAAAPSDGGYTPSGGDLDDEIPFGPCVD
ncbi:single-stranded DNA-binding protein [Acidiphilium acidophilum]|uniref:single-stranded DNA-binding protein n=1 Tax=Acidiphilium acidophilum TaxID=76588 RepID=UPI002E8E7016|nr:single-stranded DNA-binding protein [Acidiphilium acidophilum]